MIYLWTAMYRYPGAIYLQTHYRVGNGKNYAISVGMN